MLHNRHPSPAPRAQYKSVAVIGPNAGCLTEPLSNSCDAINAQLGGYAQVGARAVTLAAAINASASEGGFSVSFARGCKCVASPHIAGPWLQARMLACTCVTMAAALTCPAASPRLCLQHR
jgi:hypothetical protein